MNYDYLIGMLSSPSGIIIDVGMVNVNSRWFLCSLITQPGTFKNNFLTVDIILSRAK